MRSRYGHAIRCKRVYHPTDQDDGLRVLVERLWPRGVSKTTAKIDLWLKAIAPSTQLRQWYGHDPTRWDEFQLRYRKELDANPGPVAELLALARQHDLTLVYAARDESVNSAQTLEAYLRSRLALNEPE